MNLINLFIAFIFGASFGSFLAVLIDRLPRGESVLLGRSKCDSCGRILTFLDLIPVFSYIALLGRCRTCHAKIPIHLFLFEIGTGVAAVVLVLYSNMMGFSFFETMYLGVILFCFGAIFLADLLYGIIPDEFIIVIVLSTFLFLGFANPSLFFQNFIAGCIAFALFLFLYLITRGRGMGFGDVKFAFAIGLFLGFPKVAVSLYVAFLTAAAVSIILVMMGRKKMKGGTIAFGPFLVLGAIFAYFFGDSVINLFI